MKYVLLAIENSEHADTLIEDMANFPDWPLLTPSQENIVMAKVSGDVFDSAVIASVLESNRQYWLLRHPSRNRTTLEGS